MEIDTTRAPTWVEALPDSLKAKGPFDLDVWQWLALPLWVVASLGAGLLIGRALHFGVTALTARTPTKHGDLIADRLALPLGFGFGLAVAYGLLPLLAPPPRLSAWIAEALKALVVVVVFWVVLRAVDVAARRLSSSTWAQNPASRSLVPLGSRILKVAIVALAAVTLFAQLGYPVASIIAGLGIGGIAIALAAQKTVENLFGAFALGLDQPLRVGDFVKIEDFVGTVEAVGLRSTRIRTLDRTLITIPNGRMADMRIESFTARDRFRLFSVLRLSLGTTPEQLRAVIAGVGKCLRAQPALWTESFTVRFAQLGEASLDVEVMAWFVTADWSAFTQIRQELLMQFLDEIAAAGASLAVPQRRIDGRVVTTAAAPP